MSMQQTMRLLEFDCKRGQATPNGLMAAAFSSRGRDFSRTYVSADLRTLPNSAVTENLSFRGFGTIRVPRASLGR
jgi:hypothetical protein